MYIYSTSIRIDVLQLILLEVHRVSALLGHFPYCLVQCLVVYVLIKGYLKFVTLGSRAYHENGM